MSMLRKYGADMTPQNNQKEKRLEVGRHMLGGLGLMAVTTISLATPCSGLRRL
jgi:hypothetical protein